MLYLSPQIPLGNRHRISLKDIQWCQVLQNPKMKNQVINMHCEHDMKCFDTCNFEHVWGLQKSVNCWHFILATRLWKQETKHIYLVWIHTCTHVHCVRNFNQNTWYARLNTSTTTREKYSQQYRPQVKRLMSIPHLRRYVHLMVHSVSIQNECLHRWVGRLSCMFSTPTWPHKTFLACSSSYSALTSTYRPFVSHFRGAGYLLLMLWCHCRI